MRIAKAFASALALLAGIAGTSAAQDEVGQFYSHVYYDMGSGLQYTPKGGYVTQLAGDVYNNTNPLSTTLAAISSTDLNAQWGDRVTTTAAGILQENDFTVYNSGSSAGPLFTSTFTIAFFDGVTSALLGGYNTSAVVFGAAGLPQNGYSIITVTGLGSLNLNLPTDVIVRQNCGLRTGTASRLGVISANPPSIGSSGATMYINASTVGPAGFYTVTNVPNPGYRINVSAPVPVAPTSWGSIKANYRN
jgi:hypothetical protein